MHNDSSPKRSRRPWQRSEFALFLAPLAALGLMWAVQRYRSSQVGRVRAVAGRRSFAPLALTRRMASPFLYEDALAIEFAPDGKSLFSAGKGHTTLIDTRRTPWTSKKRFSAMGWIYAAAYSPDGKVIASGGDDHRVQFISTQTGKVLRVLAPSSVYSIKALSFSPDGKHLAVGRGIQGFGNVAVWSSEGAIKLWEKPDDSDNNYEVQSLSYSPDGRVVAGARFPSNNGEADSGRCLLTFWDAATGSTLRTIEGKIDNHGLNSGSEGNTGSEPTASLAYSPDRRTIAVNWSGATLLDAATGRIVSQFPHPLVSVSRVAFSRDGRWLATGGSTIRTTPEISDYEVTVWDVATQYPLRTFRFQDKPGGAWRGQVTALRFSPNRKTLVACYANKSIGGQILRWDLSTLPPLRRNTASTSSSPSSTKGQ